MSFGVGIRRVKSVMVARFMKTYLSFIVIYTSYYHKQIRLLVNDCLINVNTKVKYQSFIYRLDGR